MAVITSIESTVRCPTETCLGHLEQGRWDEFPRCDTCLREFRLINTNEKISKQDEWSLREQVGDLQSKLDEIASLATW